MSMTMRGLLVMVVTANVISPWQREGLGINLECPNSHVQSFLAES